MADVCIDQYNTVSLVFRFLLLELLGQIIYFWNSVQPYLKEEVATVSGIVLAVVGLVPLCLFSIIPRAVTSVTVCIALVHRW